MADFIAYFRNMLLKYELGNSYWDFDISPLNYELLYIIFISLSLSVLLMEKQILSHRMPSSDPMGPICVSSSFLTPTFCIHVYNIFTSKQITTHTLNIICLCKMIFVFVL